MKSSLMGGLNNVFISKRTHSTGHGTARHGSEHGSNNGGVNKDIIIMWEKVKERNWNQNWFPDGEREPGSSGRTSSTPAQLINQLCHALSRELEAAQIAAVDRRMNIPESCWTWTKAARSPAIAAKWNSSRREIFLTAPCEAFDSGQHRVCCYLLALQNNIYSILIIDCLFCAASAPVCFSLVARCLFYALLFAFFLYT